MSLEDTVDITAIVGMVEAETVEEANQLIVQDGATLLHAEFGVAGNADRFVLGYYKQDPPPPVPPAPQGSTSVVPQGLPEP